MKTESITYHCYFLQTLRQGWIGDLTVGIAGLAIPLSFAPYGYYLVTVLSLCCLFFLWQDVTPFRAFQRGWLFGVGMFSHGMYWLYLTFHQFAAISFSDSAALLLILFTFMALFPATLGFIANQFQSLNLVGRFVFFLPAGWTLLEWARSWLLVGFPWLSLGYGQIDSPLAGFAPLLGIYGVSWMIALSTGLLAVLILGTRRERGFSLIALLILWSAGRMLNQVAWTIPSRDTIKVSLLQGNIPQKIKWQPAHRSRILQQYLELASDQLDKDLIIWPETAIPFYKHEAEQEFLPKLRRIAVDSDTVHIVGIPVQDLTDGRHFNSILAIGTDMGIYHKQHLVPFGEYIPFRWVFDPLIALLEYKKGDLSHGPKFQPSFRVAGYPIGVSICFEIAFGEEIISDLPDAALLINITNDAWFGNTIAPHQHLEIARMRALETGRYLLRAANTGISAIINPKGAVISSIPMLQTLVLEGKVEPYLGATPYVVLGNFTVLAGTIFSILIALTLCFRKERSHFQ